MATEDLKAYVEQNLYKVRPCEDYLSEFNECSSFKKKFHTYFIEGHTGDCSVWKEDYKNCLKPKENLDAFASIIKHEDERIRKRLENHLRNDVWEKRDSPPPNWNSELPENLREKQNDAFKSLRMEQPCVIL